MIVHTVAFKLKHAPGSEAEQLFLEKGTASRQKGLIPIIRQHMLFSII